ncbi:hypothetical protein M8C21_010370 [Ambrosia artemisiifolia]|uniref:FAM91 C-terminal domain-containing protein n=1 Tax=Ambrosia artemisiifolia TaxID=4212 RepID=A0AAD5D7U2_AMBAR|nr:hypothetical protein M8C21_010370 [Ambrosia artemisiifolia]
MGEGCDCLKSHAVTLYEAGKLGYASIEDLCNDLSTLEGKRFEGELQEFANHAFSLRVVLKCLTSGGLSPDELDTPAVSSSNDEEVTSMVADMSLKQESEPAVNEMGPLANDSDTTNGVANDVENIIQKKVRKYRVDILRCESLANLPSTTLESLFKRDYDIIVSMVPLPVSSFLPGPKGPVHFGPPSHSSMSPWMNLVLYSAVSCGPVSVVLMKGQCLRLLPAPLAGCEKALIWSWDGSSVAGLGSKFQGNLVKGSILLHCINSLLKHTAIFVQPFSRFDLNESGKMNTIDIPLPLKNSDGLFAGIEKEALGLELTTAEISKMNSLLSNLADKLSLWTVGYIRLLKLYKEGNKNAFAPDNDVNYEWVPLCVEFGIPLFSPKLCNFICQRVVSSQLLQTESFTENRDAMQELRRRQRCHSEILSFDGNILRSYALSSAYEDDTKLNEESHKMESDDVKDTGETMLPGVNLLFDGSELRPFDIGACLQARQPASLIAEATAMSAAIK